MEGIYICLQFTPFPQTNLIANASKVLLPTVYWAFFVKS